MYGFGQWMIFVCVCICMCNMLMHDCVCVWERENHFMCLSLCCFLFPLRGKYRHQRDQVSWCVFQPRGSQLCKECRMCIKSMHSLLNSHTTIVMYSTGHMYSIVDICHSILEICCCYPLLLNPSPLPVSKSVCSIATKQKQSHIVFCHYYWECFIYIYVYLTMLHFTCHSRICTLHIW